MENTVNTGDQTPQQTKSAQSPTQFFAKHGAIVGCALALLFLAFYAMSGKNSDSNYSGLANTVMLVLGLLFFTRKYLTDYAIEYVRFGIAYKGSFMIGLFASLLLLVFNYVFYRLSPNFINTLLLAIQSAYQQSGLLKGDDLEAALKLIKSVTTPGFLAVSSFVGMVFKTAFYSLLVALLLSNGSLARRRGSAFDRDMSELDR